jgi:putative transposase
MRTGNHTISELQIHIVWVTKYRYKVLQGKIQERCREIIIQICDAEDIRILSGVVSKEHVHMHIEYPSKKSVSDIVKKLQG